MTIILTGDDLTPADVVAVARHGAAVSLGAVARSEIIRVRDHIEQHWMGGDAPPIYGFNTGVGKLKGYAISPEDNRQFQIRLVLSHCGGLGDPAPVDVVRAMMLIRVNAFCQGVSGLRIAVVDRIVELLNKGVTPVVPVQGSVGASGDLAPLAHMVAAMIGLPQAECDYAGRRMAAPDALAAAGIAPVHFDLEAKDTLACVNGNALSAAIATLNLHDAWQLVRMADITAALSLEAVRGERAAFDERLHRVRKQPGQIDCAANIRALVRGSERTSDEARQVRLPHDLMNPEYKPRVQDVYSLRCAPQVHGAVRGNLTYCHDVLSREINAATDNPLVFWNSAGGLDPISGGNFHCEPIAFASDIATLSLTEMANIAERRLFMICDPSLSYGLPPMLAGEPAGLNSGFPVIACSAAAVTSEMRTLSFPASADNIPTKSSQEDHVSMATWAARKTARVLPCLEKVLGIEYLIAARAVFITADRLGRFRLGDGTTVAYDGLARQDVFTADDSYMPQQSGAAVDAVASRSLLRDVESRIGPLL
ncbi:MAG: aromatic amino acid ammonia-lyase [Alphaproteobacteria bacterium]